VKLEGARKRERAREREMKRGRKTEVECSNSIDERGKPELVELRQLISASESVSGRNPKGGHVGSDGD
jgi:hypothetical protein